MSTTTMLSLIGQVFNELGLTAPSSVAGNTQQSVIQMLALMNAVGYEVQREKDWQAMTVIYRFNTVFYTYTGTLTSGSTSITGLSSTTGLTSTPTYFQVTGTGVASDCFLVSVDAVTSSAVMSTAATASGTVSITFNQVMYAFPSGFDRLIDRTDWDKTQHWEMLGPETPQQWEWLKSGYISTGPRVRFRQLGNLFQIWPALGAQHQLGFEYQSNLWVTATGGSSPTKAAFTVDTDTCIFPDRLIVLGTKKKYFEIKGFDTTALYRDYKDQLDIAKSADAGSPTLSLAPRPTNILIGFENIPDANYGT